MEEHTINGARAAAMRLVLQDLLSSGKSEGAPVLGRYEEEVEIEKAEPEKTETLIWRIVVLR